MSKITVKKLKVISLTLMCWSLLLISSGIAMCTKNTVTTKYTYSINITKNKIAESKTNIIKLKEMKLEINTPLSVDIKDYIEDINNIEEDVLNSLKLDTSNVKTSEAGTYTYTISYKKKKYNGVFIITEKKLPKVTITLKNLTIKKDSTLDTKISSYIEETLSEEIINNITLDLSKVKTNIAGTYQYTVTYNNKLYTANIEIYEPKAPTIITPNTVEEDSANKAQDNKTSPEENTVSDSKTE